MHATATKPSTVKAPAMPAGTFILRVKHGSGSVEFETFRPVGETVEVRKMFGNDLGGFAPRQMTKTEARSYWTRCLTEWGYERVA